MPTRSQIAKDALRKIAKNNRGTSAAAASTVLPRKTRHPVTGCRAYSLMGMWLMDVAVLDALRQQALSYDLKQLAAWNQQQQVEGPITDLGGSDGGTAQRLPYVLNGGTAVIDVSGPITKFTTSFSAMMGGTSTTFMEKQVTHALGNPDVKELMFHFDTHGGTVDGTFDMAEIIARADKVKPCYAHAEDNCMSGGYLLASQCRSITTNPTGQIGSIGVLTGIVDSSKKFEAEKIKVYPIKTGTLKGMGMPGVPVTDAQVAHLQSIADSIFDVFTQKVSDGRGLSVKEITDLQAGVFVGKTAKSKGLVDGIMLFQDSLREVQANRATASAAPKRGPAAGATSTVTAPRGIAMPYTAQQIEQARKLPGAENVTEANADQTVLDIATKLSAENTSLKGQIPAKIDDGLRTGKIKLAADQINFLGEKGVLLPAQIEALKDAPVVQSDGNVYLAADKVFAALQLNKPAGVVAPVTGAQPAARDVPGETDKPKVVSKERVAELAAHVGISPTA